MLSAKNITKKFSGVVALDGVNLDLQAGQVHAIIGENGAGKSTLMKILSGVYTDYEGVIMRDNQPIKFDGTRAAQAAGVAIIHQELNLIPQLTIAENMFLGREITNRFGLLDTAQMRQITEGVLRRVKLAVDPSETTQNLKIGQQQLVEIAKALLLDAQIVIMDEPTSAITGAEVETLFGIIADLKKEGKAIAYISHKLDELFKIANTYTVLRDGKSVDFGDIKNITKEGLVAKMVGRDLVFSQKKTSRNNRDESPSVSDEILLEIKNLSLNTPLNKNGSNINFQLKKGEILGVFGLMGAGRTELFEAIFGLNEQQTTGLILIEGQQKAIKNPSDAVKFGLALVSEDRKKDGIVPEWSVRKNISLTTLLGLSKNGILSFKKEKKLAETSINNLKIKTNSDAQLIKTLSGGNQQKAILAKWLATKPKVLLLDEPTRGIDVNAKAEIYKLIKDLAATGLGIVMVSSELPEIFAVADRVLVLSEGKLTGDFSIETATEEGLLQAAMA